MNKVGSNGRFQKMAFVVYCFSTCCVGFVVYCLSYLELMPAFECTSATNPVPYACKQEDFCGNPDITYSIVPGPETLSNGVEKLSLICRPGWQIGLLGSALFAGWCSTMLWLPQFGDRYGRYRIFFIGNLINLILYSILMLSHSYWLSVVTIFFIGALESIRLSIGYNYCMELIGVKYQTFYGTVWNVNEGAIYLWATIYFGFIAKTWFPFVMIGYTLACIATVCVYFFPESPPWCIEMKYF